MYVSQGYIDLLFARDSYTTYSCHNLTLPLFYETNLAVFLVARCDEMNSLAPAALFPNRKTHSLTLPLLVLWLKLVDDIYTAFAAHNLVIGTDFFNASTHFHADHHSLMLW